MPSGGYGPGDMADADKVASAMEDKTVKQYGLQGEWIAAYIAARIAGANPNAAEAAAYIEWDL